MDKSRAARRVADNLVDIEIDPVRYKEVYEECFRILKEEQDAINSMGEFAQEYFPKEQAHYKAIELIKKDCKGRYDQ